MANDYLDYEELKRLHNIGLKSSLSFRPATESDLDELLRINAQVIGKWELDNFMQVFQHELPFIVMCNGDTIIGYGVYLLVLDEARIINITVDSEYRGLGYGRIMMEYMIDEVRELNMKYVLLDVRVKNIAAINLYTKMGFAILCRRHEYYNTEELIEDAYFMQLPIIS